jgi:hypothetical protein
MYTDAEILALEPQYDLLEAPTRAGVIGFARALLAGEKAPVAVDLPWGDEIGLKRLMALTDASVPSGYGNGAGTKGYWHNLIGWKGPRGVERLAGNFGISAGKFVVDVTELAREWQQKPWEHFGILFTTGNLNVLFYSREQAEAQFHPKLVINDGIEIPCVADVSIGHGTGAKTAGDAPRTQLANTWDAAFRFADIPPDIQIGRAVVVLSVYKTYDKDGQWRLLEIVPPVEFNPPTIADPMGASGNYFESAQCGADPTISPYEQRLWNSIIAPDPYGKATAEEENGEKFVRCYWNNQKQTNSWSIPIYKGHILGNSDPTEGRRVHLSYKIRLADNFSRAVRTTGKFPGFSSAGKEAGVYRHPWPGEPHRGNKTGVLWAGNGGGKVHGFDGWSARGGYAPRVNGGVDHPAAACTQLHTYAYFLRKGNVLNHEIFKRYEIAHGIAPGSNYLPNKEPLTNFLLPGESIWPGASGTGKGFNWDYAAPGGLLWPTRWHRVDQVIRINDPLEANGELDAYIDGRQVGRIRDVQWRSHEPKWPKDSTLGVACCWFNFYQGGTDEYRNMTEETHWDIKHVAVRVLEWDE